MSVISRFHYSTISRFHGFTVILLVKAWNTELLFHYWDPTVKFRFESWIRYILLQSLISTLHGFTVSRFNFLRTQKVREFLKLAIYLYINRLFVHKNFWKNYKSSLTGLRSKKQILPVLKLLSCCTILDRILFLFGGVVQKEYSHNKRSSTSASMSSIFELWLW